jgi:hypothetical protein
MSRFEKRTIPKNEVRTTARRLRMAGTGRHDIAPTRVPTPSRREPERCVGKRSLGSRVGPRCTLHGYGLLGQLQHRGRAVWRTGRPIMRASQPVLRWTRRRRTERTSDMPDSSPERVLHAHMPFRYRLLLRSRGVPDRFEASVRAIRVVGNDVLLRELLGGGHRSGARRGCHRPDSLLSEHGERVVFLSIDGRRKRQ